MWAWLYLALGGFAMVLTWAYAVRESAIVFTAAMSGAIWALLAVTTEITVASGGGDVAFEVGPARWIFAGLGLLSLVALTGAIIGVYPESHPDPTHAEV